MNILSEANLRYLNMIIQCDGIHCATVNCPLYDGAQCTANRTIRTIATQLQSKFAHVCNEEINIEEKHNQDESKIS